MPPASPKLVSGQGKQVIPPGKDRLEEKEQAEFAAVLAPIQGAEAAKQEAEEKASAVHSQALPISPVPPSQFGASGPKPGKTRLNAIEPIKPRASSGADARPPPGVLPQSDQHRLRDSVKRICNANYLIHQAQKSGDFRDHPEVEKLKESEQKKTGDTVPFHPESPFIRKWDVVLAGLLTVTALVTPFEIAFLESSLDGMFILNRVLDAGFILDICIQFNLAYNDRSGRLVNSKSKVAKHYICGWFFMDVASTVPYDLITSLTADDDSAAGGTAMLRMLKLFKLTKLLRIVKSAQTFMRIMNALELKNATTDLIKYGTTVLVFIHWGACVWRLTPDMSTFKLEDTWMAPESIGQDQSAWSLYINCVEFSLMCLVVGYGSVYPANPTERTVAVVLMIVCGATYAYVIGGICEVLSSSDPITKHYEQSMDLLTSFGRENELSPELKIDMRKYFMYNVDIFRWRMYQDVTSMLSPSLQAKAAQHTHKKFLQTITFFHSPVRHEKEAFLQDISLLMEFAAFAPADFICCFGHEADKMYVLKRGIAREGNQLLSKPGTYFGDEMLLPRAVRRTNIVSVSYVGCLSLARHALFELLDTKGQVYATTYRLVRRQVARLRLRRAVKHLGQCVIMIKTHNGTRMTAEQKVLYVDELRIKGLGTPPKCEYFYPHINVKSATCPEAAKEQYKLANAQSARGRKVLFGAVEDEGARKKKKDALVRNAEKLIHLWQKVKDGHQQEGAALKSMAENETIPSVATSAAEEQLLYGTAPTVEAKQPGGAGAGGKSERQILKKVGELEKDNKALRSDLKEIHIKLDRLLATSK